MATNNAANYSPTQYNVQIGGVDGTLTNVAPSATSGVAVISQGSSSNPTFGTVVVAGGGTGATSLTGVLTGNGTSAFTGSAVTNHNVLVGAASNAITSVAPSATSGVPLISGGSSADPSFGTAVVAGGGTGAVTFTAYAPVIAGTTATGAFQSASTGLSTSGFVLTSNGSSAVPSFQAAAFTGMAFTVITADQSAAINNGYICNKAGLLTLTLPTTAAAGTIIEVTGMNTALGWKIGQNASQQIFFGTSATTSGTGGSLASSNIYDSVRLVCNTANLTWIVLSSVGNITVV